MLSGRLVQTIESHWEEIAGRLIQKIRRHPETPVLAGRPEAEIREWCHAILGNLGDWLGHGQESEVRRRYEALGRDRFEEAIPLHEAVLRFYMLKEAVSDFVREYWVPVDSMQLYAGEEFDRRVSRFFDHLVYYVVRGYEEARRRTARYA